MKKLLPVCTLILLCCSGLSGCSQTPYSDQDGVAGQAGATQAEKDEYEKLTHGEVAELGPSTGNLMALKLLVDAVQDDIAAQTK